HPVGGIQPQAVSQRRVAGGQHAAVAHAAEVFGRVETETADVAPAARGATVVGGADRLSSVFDYGDVAAGGDLADPVDLGALTEQVHRNDRFGSRRDGRFDFLGVDVERVAADVDE